MCPFIDPPAVGSPWQPLLREAQILQRSPTFVNNWALRCTQHTPKWRAHGLAGYVRGAWLLFFFTFLCSDGHAGNLGKAIVCRTMVSLKRLISIFVTFPGQKRIPAIKKRPFTGPQVSSSISGIKCFRTIHVKGGKPLFFWLWTFPQLSSEHRTALVRINYPPSPHESFFFPDFQAFSDYFLLRLITPIHWPVVDKVHDLKYKSFGSAVRPLPMKAAALELKHWITGFFTIHQYSSIIFFFFCHQHCCIVFMSHALTEPHHCLNPPNECTDSGRSTVLRHRDAIESNRMNKIGKTLLFC